MELAILTDELSLDLDEALTEGRKLGFRKYEVRCIDSYQERIPHIKPERLQQLVGLVEKGEIEIVALTPGIFKIDFSDTKRIRSEIEETLHETCEWAVRLKSKKIIVFGFLRDAGGIESTVIDYLSEAADIAKKYDLLISVENEPGAFCDTGVNTARKIVKSVKAENIGVNWDPANAVISGESAYPIGYDAVLPYIHNVHIKDSIPLPQGKWENRLIGEGGVNWLGQLKALVRDQPIDYLTLETHVFPTLESTIEDLRRLKIYFDAVRSLNG